MERPMTDEEWEAPLDAETEAQIDRALANARDPYDEEVAISATYDRGRDLLMVCLKTGQRLAIPRQELQGLTDVDANLVSQVEIVMLGMALHWEALNVDHKVDHLRQGFYGSERWMRKLEERRGSRAGAALSRSA